MLFNSYIFIFLFLPSVLFSFYLFSLINKKKISFYILLVSSFIFYFYWNYKLGFIIISSILFNYAIAYFIKKSDKKIYILIFAIFVNISLLFYFKYTNFFLTNINYIFEINYNLKNIFLPLAISFFTIQQIGYLIDVYEDIYFERNILKYSLFVAFFPQLIAGPIIHISDVSKTLLNPKEYYLKNINIINGLLIFIIGLSQNN